MKIFKLNYLAGGYRKMFLYTIEMIVFVTCITFLSMSYRTFGPLQSPILLLEPVKVSASELSRDGDHIEGHEVQITRDIKYNKRESVLLTTQLTNKEFDYVLHLRDVKLPPSVVGTVHSTKLYYVSHLNRGHWCMKTTSYWKPKFSFGERVTTWPDSCFEVH